MATILYITQIQLAHGAVRLLPQECERAGIKKPLVVTDAGVRAAHVPVELEIARGVTHDFIKMGRALDEARHAQALAGAALRRAFEP